MFTLTLNKKQTHFAKPAVMGILNITADSFYSESRKQSIDEALHTTEKMLKDGAAFIDIGGQSTRPDSQLVSVEDELRKVLPVVEAIHKNFTDTYISIDTFYSKVAEECICAGATIVNDISGGNIDKAMLKTVAKLKVPYVCMHMKGTPQTMQQYTNYNNVITEVYEYFANKINDANTLNIENLIIDIGFGFAKAPTENFELIKSLGAFSQLQKPILVGVSRKSSIYKTLNITPEEALNGTTVLNTIAIKNGASILRVHDVKEAVEVIKLCEFIL